MGEVTTICRHPLSSRPLSAARSTPGQPRRLQIFTTAAALTAQLARDRTGGLTVGFVPTMGALHRGHAELVIQCVKACNRCVVSVFVNPTQFDDGADLAAYPVTPAEDERLLRLSGCHYLFRPSREEVYPAGLVDPTAHLDFGPLTERMEGAHRPGHFAGVAQVVHRLLTIVEPDVFYLGQKDYQQVAVIKRMLDLLAMRVTVITVATVRERDGLALSSRNRRLTADQRAAAARINSHLAVVAAGLRCRWPARELERLAFAGMLASPLLEPEYVEVVDGQTLMPYFDGDVVGALVVATAVRVGSVRLIDNHVFTIANP